MRRGVVRRPQRRVLRRKAREGCEVVPGLPVLGRAAPAVPGLGADGAPGLALAFCLPGPEGAAASCSAPQTSLLDTETRRVPASLCQLARRPAAQQPHDCACRLWVTKMARSSHRATGGSVAAGVERGAAAAGPGAGCGDPGYLLEPAVCGHGAGRAVPVSTGRRPQDCDTLCSQPSTVLLLPTCKPLQICAHALTRQAACLTVKNALPEHIQTCPWKWATLLKLLGLPKRRSCTERIGTPC